jgi:hypothetical protein
MKGREKSGVDCGFRTAEFHKTRRRTTAILVMKNLFDAPSEQPGSQGVGH